MLADAARDLKPSNIMLDLDTRKVKVCDFGLSLLLPPGHERQAGAKGTPAYVAPEVSDAVFCLVFSLSSAGQEAAHQPCLRCLQLRDHGIFLCDSPVSLH